MRPALEKLSKEADEGAGRAEHEGYREGDGEEDVLVGDIGVDPAVVSHSLYLSVFSCFISRHSCGVYRLRYRL
jgi:hypothetical protein